MRIAVSLFAIETLCFVSHLPTAKAEGLTTLPFQRNELLLLESYHAGPASISDLPPSFSF